MRCCRGRCCRRSRRCSSRRAQAIVGLVALAALSATLEPVSGARLRALLTPHLIASLLAVSLLGTIVGHSIYLRLLRVWGAFRAGLYAFVSPVVALVAGALVFGESIGWREVVGAAAMLAGAAVAMRRPAQRHAIDADQGDRWRPMNFSSRACDARQAAPLPPTCTPCPGLTPFGTSLRRRTGASLSKPWYAPA